VGVAVLRLFFVLLFVVKDEKRSFFEYEKEREREREREGVCKDKNKAHLADVSNRPFYQHT